LISTTSASDRCVNCARLRRNARDAKRRRVGYHEIVCIQCGETFYPIRFPARFCSPRCRVAAYRQQISPPAPSP
jgi:hypothetical protein